MNFQVADGVVLRQVQDELVLLNTHTEEYFGLDSVGLRVWELVTSGSDFSACVNVMAAEYEAARDAIERDISELLRQLVDSKLLIQQD